MQPIPRRTILRRGAAAGAGLAIAGARTGGADDRKVVVGLIGAGGMGTSHLRLLAERRDVEIAHVCDVDGERLAAALSVVEKGAGKAPAGDRDLRRVLDDPRVEAVWIATPDHWHAPAAILALDAGKHVYVEKPCCHNIREGRLMAQAVARSGRLLQVGTQSRSTEVVRDAIDRVRGGAIGDVLVAKAWNSQRRGAIGKSQPTQPPAQLDYDLWVGPAPMVPLSAQPPAEHLAVVVRLRLRRRRQRRRPRHRRGPLGPRSGKPTPAGWPAWGGKSFFDDDQQFPDTQYAVFEYPDAAGPGRAKRLVFEQRIWSPYVQEGYENGAAFYGTEGVMVIGHTVGWTLYGPKKPEDRRAIRPRRPRGASRQLPRLRARRGEGPQRRRRGRPSLGHPGPPGEHRGQGGAGSSISTPSPRRSSATRRPPRWSRDAIARATGPCRRRPDGPVKRRGARRAGASAARRGGG